MVSIQKGATIAFDNYSAFVRGYVRSTCPRQNAFRAEASAHKEWSSGWARASGKRDSRISTPEESGPAQPNQASNHEAAEMFRCPPRLFDAHHQPFNVVLLRDRDKLVDDATDQVLAYH